MKIKYNEKFSIWYVNIVYSFEKYVFLKIDVKYLKIFFWYF